MKVLLIATAAIVSVAGQALAAPDANPPAAVPILSGAYIYNFIETCAGSVTPSVMSGVIKFNSKTAAVTLSAYRTSGSTTITLSHVAASATYSNTATTVTLNSGGVRDTYQATYGGLLANGIATNVSWIASVFNGTCGDIAWLTRQ